VDEPVDYRFLLANERTFLAYVRTALALQVTGLGVLQFLTHSHNAVRYSLGLVLVLAGSALGGAGYRRFRANERAIRAGVDIGGSGSATLLAGAVVLVPLFAAVVLTVVAAL
jgi:inner membrane protein YidH